MCSDVLLPLLIDPLRLGSPGDGLGVKLVNAGLGGYYFINKVKMVTTAFFAAD